MTIASDVAKSLDDEYEQGYEDGYRDASEGVDAGEGTYAEGYVHGIQDMSYLVPDWVGTVKPNAICPTGPHRLGANAGSCDFCMGVLPLIALTN